jgi:hypothetical protein
VRLDRKLLLIAPTIVLVLVVAGMAYAATQLHVLGSVSDTWKERDAFVSSVEHGKRSMTERQAVGLLRLSLDVETKRSAAIVASRELLIVLAGIALLSCGALAAGIRSVPREHWPRFGSRSGSDA